MRSDISDNEVQDEKPAGLFDQDVAIEGKRVRKNVERFKAVEISSPKTTIKFEGRGTPLGEIESINNEIGKRTSESLKNLHRILFKTVGKLTVLKKEIRQFNGFAFDIDSEEFKKRKELTSKYSMDQLRVVKSILGLKQSSEYNGKNGLVDLIMKFLENPEDSHKKVKKAEKRRSADGKKGREGVKKKRIRTEKNDESSDESSVEKDDENNSDDEEEEKEEVAPIKIKKRVSFEDEQDELPKEEEEKEEEVSVEHTEEKASDSDDGHEVENELPSEVVASIEKILKEVEDISKIKLRWVCEETIKVHPEQKANVRLIKEKAIKTLKNLSPSASNE